MEEPCEACCPIAVLITVSSRKGRRHCSQGKNATLVTFSNVRPDRDIFLERNGWGRPLAYFTKAEPHQGEQGEEVFLVVT